MKSQAVAPKAFGAKLPRSVDGQTPIAIKKILVPVDFSVASNNAVKFARRISGFTGADIVFLHVIEPDSSLALKNLPSICSDELKANAEENLRFLVRAAREAGDEGATSVTRSGLATHEIVEAAKDLDVDLIILAAHGHKGWKHFSIGSTAERVIRAAPCPALVLREKDHDFI